MRLSVLSSRASCGQNCEQFIYSKRREERVTRVQVKVGEWLLVGAGPFCISARVPLEANDPR